MDFAASGGALGAAWLPALPVSLGLLAGLVRFRQRTRRKERPAAGGNPTERAEERLEKLNGALLALGADSRANIDRLTAACGELLGATCALYNRLDSGLLCSVGTWQAPAALERSGRPEGHLCYDVIRGGSSGRVVVVRDLPNTPYAQSDPNVARYGLRTYAGCPVSFGGWTRGSLCVVFDRDLELDEGDTRIMQALARAIGHEEDRARAGRALLERERAQAALYEISEAAHSVASLHELFVSIHGTVSQLMAAQNFYIALHHPEANLISFPYFVDEVDEAPPPAPPGRGLTEYVLRTGKPLLASPEVFEDLVRRGEVELVGAPSIDWLGVPLTVREQTIGVLVVQSYTKGVRYGERERDLLTFVSRQIALAIERKRTEDALRQSEELYRTLVDNSQDGVFLIQDGVIEFANEAFAKMVGLAARDVTGRQFAELVAPEDVEMVRDRYRRRQAGEDVPREYEFTALHADGATRVPVNMQVGLTTYRGRVASTGTIRSLAERRRLEEQLRQAQKIEALGQLSGGVAHDFNNLLMAMMGSVELLQRRLAGDDAMREELETILRSCRRAGELTRGLLAFARRQVLEAVDLDLNQVVAQMVPVLRRVIPENIVIDVTPGAGLGTVRADRGQMDQILMNLAVNGRDAMPAGGSITIRTANASIGEPYQALHPWARPGEYVLLSVRDTGVGMDEVTLAHAFEPFFTTKGPGRGTGLGLAVVYGIVKQHGGMIDVSSGPGHGATFEIYLPVVASLPVVLPSIQEGAVVGGQETVLVVEDEGEVRHILVEALSALGYHVLEAADGVDALEILSARKGDVALVVSDVVMSRMGGKELYESARTLVPATRFLFSSGYGDTLVQEAPGYGPPAAFIAKPYGIDDLARRVREVLDR